MATPATARRAEPDHARFPPDRAAPPSPTRSENPRPSISPLSAKASPVALRDVKMLDPNIDTEMAGAATHTEIGNRDDDDRSSSLSEPEDDLDDEAHHNGYKADLETSEQRSAHQSLEVDSEAETERLDHTPNGARKQVEDIGRTPSKLNQTSAADDELSDPPSPLPAGPGAASSTSTLETATGKKRKRSATADSSLSSADSELDESPRKRSHSSGVDDPTTDITPSTKDTVEDEGEDEPVEEVAATQSEPINQPLAPAVKGGKGKRGPKPKGRPRKDATTQLDSDKNTPVAQPEVLTEEAAAKVQEEQRHKPAAATAFEDLAKQFAAFREKMFNERLAAADAELEMLAQPECKHPEYLRQVACIDARRSKQISEGNAFYKYKLESLRRTTLGERSQIHSQYFQFARQLREEVMEQLGDDWYKIQNERRQSSQKEDENYIYKFPTKRSDQVKQQAKYNQEVSVLSGIAKYVGFPAAPDISGAEGDVLDDDLKAMKITKRVPVSSAHHQPVYFPNRTGLVQPQSERLAHEQFIEQNPWARPQGPILNHGTPNLTHTPDWAEPHATKTLMRNMGGGLHRVGSPYATPLPQRRAPIEQSSSGTVAVNSDAADPPSSVVAGPPTSDRAMQGQVGREQISPLTMSKHRQNGGEPSRYRNMSNLSGASTIDAPSSTEKERGMARESLTGASKDAMASQHVFDSSQLHRHAYDAKRQHEVYQNASFRPQEGVYGTATPFPASGMPH